MRVEELHYAIEQLGLREHGRKYVMIDKDGQYVQVTDIRVLNADEVILRYK